MRCGAVYAVLCCAVLCHAVLCGACTVLRWRLAAQHFVVSSTGGVASLVSHVVAGFEQLKVVLEAVLVRSDQEEP